jgi:hypothetical protein
MPVSITPITTPSPPAVAAGRRTGVAAGTGVPSARTVCTGVTAATRGSLRTAATCCPDI